MILHICTRADWAEAAGRTELRPASLDTVGFVHCSDPGTVHLPARRLFAGREDVLLLELDETALGAPLRWEPGEPPIRDGPWFPHLYGPIPRAAVRAVHEYPPGPGGDFPLPSALAHR